MSLAKSMTIMEALQWANNKLRKSGIDSPMLEAEILLAFVLDIPKARLFSQFSDNLKSHHREMFFSLIERRVNREPIAYLVGHKSFYGRDFIVNNNVLIPRPETETLVEQAIEFLKDQDPERTLVADIGTGSGAIAISLCTETHFPVIASDIDAHALDIAKHNAVRLASETSIDFQEGNLAEPLIRLFKMIRGQTNVQTSSVYPFKTLLITANLPYLSQFQMDNLQQDVRYEPEKALRAGTDGLDAYWELFRQLRSHRHILPREIILFVEIDPDQTNGITKLILHSFPDADIAIIQDLTRRDRIVKIQI